MNIFKRSEPRHRKQYESELGERIPHAFTTAIKTATALAGSAKSKEILSCFFGKKMSIRNPTSTRWYSHLLAIFKLQNYQDGVKMLCESSEDTPFTSKRNTDQRNHLLQSDFWKTLKAALPIARALCLLQAAGETRNKMEASFRARPGGCGAWCLEQADLTSEEKAALTERIDYQMEECMRREDYVAQT
eukprot:CAMPEP_0184752036 /NCGR_PEP_ID=MMETSP0315-20130426/43368_1 /TAXON_ID=101924 /ORGANISM="Rhodosorus marinus, Strain UTEX LB 2760" /LENGTH=188 /DNA_ID=CAMNT_0027231349 /DNA_START=807 /DNA_END=1374 /DNA_ORIENTATION=+